MIAELLLGLSVVVPTGFTDTPPPVLQVQFVEPVQEVVTYPPQGVLNQLSGLELPPVVRDAFETDFLGETLYFGAFAITKDFGYGYMTGANSLEAARDIALQECLKQGPTCLIYAEILPVNYVPLLRGQVTMAPEPRGYFLNPDPAWGNFRAMAISEDGAYSLQYGHNTPRAANAAALASCEEYTIANLPDLRDMPCVLIPFK